MPSPLALPPGYRIERSRDGFALHSDHFGEIGEGDFGCWAAACAAAIDHVEDMASEAAQDAADLLMEAEYDRLYNLINAEGGYCSRTDPVGQARNRAVSGVLAAIDAMRASDVAEQQREAA